MLLWSKGFQEQSGSKCKCGIHYFEGDKRIQKTWVYLVKMIENQNQSN
jgi:hypothetical protein